MNALIVGCLARAQQLSGATLHAVAVLSNHLHILGTFESSRQMAQLMCHFKSNLAKEIGTRIRGWDGSMFGPRYRSTPVSDEPEAQIARLEYILGQGCKEGLVLSPREWPGVQSIDALTRRGGALRGIWVDRSTLSDARDRGLQMSEADVTHEMTVPLAPLPCWRHLRPKAVRRRVRTIVRSIEEETVAMHRRRGTAPLGVEAILRQDPESRPKDPRLRHAIRFHAATRGMRLALLEAYRLFETAYRAAAERLASGDRTVQFPDDCFPPRLPFVDPAPIRAG